MVFEFAFTYFPSASLIFSFSTVLVRPYVQIPFIYSLTRGFFLLLLESEKSASCFSGREKGQTDVSHERNEGSQGE